MDTSIPAPSLAHRVKRLGHLDLPGGGQVVVQGTQALVGHINAPHGTTILDVSDPTLPRVIATIELEDAHEHSHKVRVVGDIMYTNLERPNRRFAAKAPPYREAHAALEKERKRPPTKAELAGKLRVNVDERYATATISGRDASWRACA